MIVAGPGTGKTLTLTHRIAWLVMHRLVSPDRILAITFTNKAAQEMTQRLGFLKSGTKYFPKVTTFHSFCFEVLSEYLFNTKKETISILDDDDRKLMIKEAIKRAEKAGIKIEQKEDRIISGITTARQLLKYPEQVEDDETRAVYTLYSDMMEKQGSVDFEDIIFKTVKIFEEESQILDMYREKFLHVFIDEYQDVNYGQYMLVKLLCTPDSSHEEAEEKKVSICAIGDPDQSIYGFRGSDTVFFKSFETDFPGARVINLVKNYRSADTILDVSYQIIRDCGETVSKERIFSGIEGKKTIRIIELPTERAEAKKIAQTIENMIGGTGYHAKDTGWINEDDITQEAEKSFSDFAVLYRTGAQAKIISETLMKYGIPFQTVSRESIFSKKGVNEFISFFKLATGFGAFTDLERLSKFLKPGPGKAALNAFKEWILKNDFTLNEAMDKAVRFPIKGIKRDSQKKVFGFLNNFIKHKNEIDNKPVKQVLFHLAENSAFSDIFDENSEAGEIYTDLLMFSRKFEKSVKEFLSALALQSDTDAYDENVEKVSLMTMHASKGLEFPVVFIAGCEEGYIPYMREGAETNINEERRLFYVGITRAKEEVLLTSAKKRRIFGKLIDREPSRFIKDIEEDLKSMEEHKARKKKKETSQVQLKLF